MKTKIIIELRSGITSMGWDNGLNLIPPSGIPKSYFFGKSLPNP